MSLPTLIEELLSISKNPETDIPGSLLYRVGVEYYFPFIPPFNISTLTTNVLVPAAPQRGFGTPTVYTPAEVFIFFCVTFGKIEPGAFHLRSVIGGNVAVDARIDGYAVEQGIDYLFFATRDQFLTAEIQNMTNKTQYFQMYSHYLIVPTKDDWEIVRNYLKERQLSVSLPISGGGK